MKNTLYLWFCLCFAGCTHMRSMSTTSIPIDRSEPVEAEAYRFLFLFINFKNHYVNAMTRDLAEQCPDRRVEGILTKQEHIMYFPLLAHAERITATGFCVDPSPRLDAKPPAETTILPEAAPSETPDKSDEVPQVGSEEGSEP